MKCKKQIKLEPAERRKDQIDTKVLLISSNRNLLIVVDRGKSSHTTVGANVIQGHSSDFESEQKKPGLRELEVESSLLIDDSAF